MTPAEYCERRPLIEITVPVYNEEHVLPASIERLHAYLTESFPFDWTILIADNASTDRTLEVAGELSRRLGGVEVLHLDEKGRGRALRASWQASDANVVCYLDADLSTGLDALLPLVAPLVTGHSDLAVGSRLSSGSAVARGPKRELISRCYNLLLRLVFAVRFRDAQCGFKAGRTEIVQRLLPGVRDEAWFFDTELLLLAEHNGLRVHEVPVDWVDDPDSRVDIRSTALGDLRGVRRMTWQFLRGRGHLDLGGHERVPLRDDFGRQTVTFALIGAFSTVIALAFFLALRDQLGAVLANAVGFTLTTVLNFWANRRFTFRRRDASGRWWHISGSVALYVFSLALASVGLALLGGRLATEVAVLVVAWGIAAVVRFVLLRSWVYRR
ncbi:bifunctional glycosyltransferase family 2/GtrA family protein [soil metagenome]